MRTIIAGSRTYNNKKEFNELIKQTDINPSVILSGGARGADKLGEELAEFLNIPLERYPAQWTIEGKSAGYKRNQKMAEKAEALIAFWDGNSRGTEHMINIARRAGLKVKVFLI